MAATGGEEGRREEWEGATSQDRFLAVVGNGCDSQTNIKNQVVKDFILM